MNEPLTLRVIGGPLDGQTMSSTADVIELVGEPDMAYVRTKVGPPPDPYWWEKGLPEPQPRERVYEWHERGWEDPDVAWIKAAYRESLTRP